MKVVNFKKAIEISLILLLPTQLVGQESQWYEFNLENIQIDFPTEEVFQLDTIVKGIRVNQLYTTVGNTTLILQKLPAESKLGDENLSSLPYDYNSLIDYYEEVVTGTKNGSNAQKVENKEIEYEELIGYNSTFYDELGNLFRESNTILVGNDLIIISCHNFEPQYGDLKNKFFNSLNLDNLRSLKQYSGKSQGYRQGYVFGKLLSYVLIGIVLFFLIRALRKKI